MYYITSIPSLVQVPGLRSSFLEGHFFGLCFHRWAGVPPLLHATHLPLLIRFRHHIFSLRQRPFLLSFPRAHETAGTPFLCFHKMGKAYLSISFLPRAQTVLRPPLPGPLFFHAFEPLFFSLTHLLAVSRSSLCHHVHFKCESPRNSCRHLDSPFPDTGNRTHPQ